MSPLDIDNPYWDAPGYGADRVEFPKPAGLDKDAIRAQHVPNTPRTHDGDGRQLHEPVQCRKCLQAWPCEVRQLVDALDATLATDGPEQ